MNASTPGLERRSERRVAVSLPVRLSGTNRMGVPFEERTSSENVSRAGIACYTIHELPPGTEIEIGIAVAAAKDEPTEFSTRGKVVHVAPGVATFKSVVGVMFTGPRFNRMFSSEATS
jgi:hypothetical protein